MAREKGPIETMGGASLQALLLLTVGRLAIREGTGDDWWWFVTGGWLLLASLVLWVDALIGVFASRTGERRGGVGG